MRAKSHWKTMDLRHIESARCVTMTTCIVVPSGSILHVASDYHIVPACPSELIEVMSSEQERQATDREFFSELCEPLCNDLELFSELAEPPVRARELLSELAESPVKPALVKMSAPRRTDSIGWQLQINGQAFWIWRNITCKSQLFDVLQLNLAEHGYRLSASSRERVGTTVKGRLHYIVKKIRARQALRDSYWCAIDIYPDEIEQGPTEVISELKNKENDLARQLEGEKKRALSGAYLLKYERRSRGFKSMIISVVNVAIQLARVESFVRRPRARNFLVQISHDPTGRSDGTIRLSTAVSLLVFAIIMTGSNNKLQLRSNLRHLQQLILLLPFRQDIAALQSDGRAAECQIDAAGASGQKNNRSRTTATATANQGCQVSRVEITCVYLLNT